MFRNFSLRQDMQIPYDNVHSTVSPCNLDEYFDRLKDAYEIHRLHEVKGFVKKNGELLGYINRITPIINNYFPRYEKCLTFCQDPEFEELDDITIYIKSIKSEFDNDWKKLDQLEKELSYITDFSTELKGLISVDLWLE